MNLHNQIMNLRVAPTELATSLYAGDTTLAYKIGHRDARHAAAALALATDAEIERLRAALASAQGGFLLAYDAASRHLHDEVLLHCGHHEAQIANVLETPNV